MSLFTQIEAAEALKGFLGDLAKNDPDLLIDTIEGETDFFTIIDAMLLSHIHDTSNIKSIDETIKKLEGRQTTIENRIQSRRDLIFSVLTRLELNKKDLKRPLATLSISKGRPKTIITNEAALPSKFFKEPPPVLDKKLLNEALANGEKIEGAELSNAVPTLSIRI